jgi:hypothetical protein
MNIHGLIESINEYLTWLDSATDPAVIENNILSLIMLFNFLFYFLGFDI